MDKYLAISQVILDLLVGIAMVAFLLIVCWVTWSIAMKVTC